eukprot:77172_1
MEVAEEARIAMAPGERARIGAATHRPRDNNVVLMEKEISGVMVMVQGEEEDKDEGKDEAMVNRVLTHKDEEQASGQRATTVQVNGQNARTTSGEQKEDEEDEEKGSEGNLIECKSCARSKYRCGLEKDEEHANLLSCTEPRLLLKYLHQSETQTSYKIQLFLINFFPISFDSSAG